MPSTPQAFVSDRMSTPIGTLLLLADREGAVRALDWLEFEDRMHRFLKRHYGESGVVLASGRAPSSVRAPLEAYFSGDVRAIDDVAVATAGTPFQRDVWAALRRIPVGQTMSYGALAASIGRPRAVRAVGLANGANPVGVIVPCHRVIGADATLTGYGGGLARKRWLLTHEGAFFHEDRARTAKRAQLDLGFGDSAMGES